MNTKPIKTIFVCTICIMVILALVLSVTGSALADEPAPTIRISTSNNYLQADDFAPNAMVTFTVYSSEGSSEEILEITRQADESGHVFIDGWEHSADLVTGNYVVAEDDTGNTKQLVLAPLTIEVFNTSADFVAGTALPGQYVWVVVGNNDIGYPEDMGVYANTDGIWTADFDYDFTDEMWGSAVVSDDDWDVTVYHLGPTPPAFISVSLTQHWFMANNFVPEKLVAFSVYKQHGDEFPVLEFSRYADGNGNLSFEGWEHTWDLEWNNFVVATDGFNTKELLLEYITFDEFDPNNDKVSGRALPGREVGVGVGNEDGEQWMNVPADEEGNWVAEFEFPVNKDYLTEDSWAGGHVADEDGDVTAAHNSGPPEPPLAWFTVFPEQNVIEGWDWPLGSNLILTIDDPTTDQSPDIEIKNIKTGQADWESRPLWVWIEFEYDVKAVDVVTLTNGITEQTHTVQNLSVTKVNQEDDTVKGVADPGAEVHVWPYATGPDQEQLAIAKKKGNAAGKWNADFSGDFDLAPGECGRSEIFDESGNRTAVDWCVPSTRFTVWPEQNRLEGYEWPARDVVSVSVAGKGTCSTEATPAFSEGEPFKTFFSVNFPEGCTIEAGDFITLSSETFSFTHQIQELTITGVNSDHGTVTGTAVFDPTQYFFHTWINDTEGAYIELPAQSGDWLADFGSLGFELQPGMSGRVELVDQASNATTVEWCIP